MESSVWIDRSLCENLRKTPRDSARKPEGKNLMRHKIYIENWKLFSLIFADDAESLRGKIQKYLQIIRPFDCTSFLLPG